MNDEQRKKIMSIYEDCQKAIREPMSHGKMIYTLPYRKNYRIHRKLFGRWGPVGRVIGDTMVNGELRHVVVFEAQEIIDWLDKAVGGSNE